MVKLMAKLMAKLMNRATARNQQTDRKAKDAAHGMRGQAGGF